MFLQDLRLVGKSETTPAESGPIQSGDHNSWKESVFWVILKQCLLCHVVGKVLSWSYSTGTPEPDSLRKKHHFLLS